MQSPINCWAAAPLVSIGKKQFKMCSTAFSVLSSWRKNKGGLQGQQDLGIRDSHSQEENTATRCKEGAKTKHPTSLWVPLALSTLQRSSGFQHIALSQQQHLSETCHSSAFSNTCQCYQNMCYCLQNAPTTLCPDASTPRQEQQPPAPACEHRQWGAGSGVSRVQAAASRWQGPTAGQPTAESCQAAACRGGLASPSGRDIKGGGWEEDNSLFCTEQEGSFGREWLSRERQSLLEEEGNLQGGRTGVVQQRMY